MTVQDTPCMELKDVTVRFGERVVLDDVRFSIVQGRHVVIMGPSGAGKSTLMRLLAGLVAPDLGTVLWKGKVASVARRIVIPAQSRQLSMVFQDLGLWPNLTVLENVMLGLRGVLGRFTERRERALKWVETCGLTSRQHALPSKLSGGEQQRVAIARGLAVEPELLFMDEPFSGLDLALRHSLLDHVTKLSRERGITLILSSHHLPDAQRIHAEVAVLEEGRIVEWGTPESLLALPRSQTMRAWASEWSENRR